MLELGLLGLWLLSAYEVYERYSLLYLGVYVLISYVVVNYVPLLVGYESVRANDAVWMIEAETNRMIITSIGMYAKCTATQMRKALEGRVFYGQKRARQFFTYVLGKPFWVEDKNFSFNDHFYIVKEEIKTMQELWAFTGKVAATPFPARMPPWCFYMIEDFQGGSVLITKFHHAFLDGIAAVSAMVHASDPQCGRDFFKMPKVSFLQQSLYTLMALVYLPFLTVHRLLSSKDQNPLHGPALSGVKSLAWTQPYKLAQYKEKCKKKGITLNDFLGAAAIRTLQKYIAENYNQNHERFTIFMPFSLRGQPEDGTPLPVDNEFAAILIKMPSATSPTLETDCARIFNHMKHSIEPFTCNLAVNILGLLPRTLAKWMLFSLANKATLLFSNVPGPRSHLTYQGAQLLHLISMSPMEASCGLAMTTISYAEEFTVACYADTVLVKDAGDLVRLLQAEIESS